MNPTYEVGDVVQIISEEEVRSHPTDDCGNFILIPSIYGAAVRLLLPAFPKAM